MPESSSQLPLREWQGRGLLIEPSLLDEPGLAHLGALDIGSLSDGNEQKRLWLDDGTVFRIAAGERIRSHLDQLFGDAGYHLWGAQLIDRVPGETHPWHSDLETCDPDGGFVSVWIGVSGVSRETCLRVIPGSHLYGAAVQSQLAWGVPEREDPEGLGVLELARRHDPAAELSIADCRDGDGVFFDGRLWHGSFNMTGSARRALLLQYARRDKSVRLVRNREVFPADFDHERLPPVLPLRGLPDPLRNENLCLEGRGPGYPGATVATRANFDHPEQQAWRRYPYFKTATPVSEVLICHASVLQPGCMPHLPHRHDLEEVLIVLEGQATILSYAEGDGVLRSIPALAGDFFYYPKNHAHTIHNASDGEIRYLMFRWKARAPARKCAAAYHYRHADYAVGPGRFSVDRDSSGLAYLHTHFTRLQPGEGFPRHVDQYDTAVLVLEGRLTMLERELGPGGVFLARAGELHNTRNDSDAACEYIVFEFHARLDN